MTYIQRLALGVSAAVLTATLPHTAFAEAAASGDKIETVDQIIVTAQKRSQSLQDVPIVVTAVSSQLLKDANVKDIKDLTVLTPGLMVTSTSSEASTTARIRGVGTVGDNLGLESSVGVVIDGVYRPRNSVGFGDLGELERVEVLKGPQGTLFGKNTSAGVINIISKRPKFVFGAEGEATISNFNGYGGSASVTGPIIEDKLAGRLFIAERHRDGYYTVVTGSGPRTRKDDQNQDFRSIRGQALWTPNAVFDVNFIADYTKRQENCCAAVQILEAGTTQNALRALDPVGGGVAIPVNPTARVAYSNRNTTQNIEDQGVSAEANWETHFLGNGKLTSITAYRDWKRTGETDPDYSTVDALAYDPAHQNAEFKQFSEELRFAGRTEKLDWMFGAFYAQEELIQNVALRYGTQFEQYANLLFGGSLAAITGRPLGTTFVAGQGQQDHYDQNEHNLAFFTNDTLHITQKLEVTLGLRYTDESKKLDTLYTNTDLGFGCSNLQARLGQSATAIATAALQCGTFQNNKFNNLPDHQSLSETETTGTLKLAYRWNKELLTYVSGARGYKAGGFNLDRLACPYKTTLACGASLAPVLNTSFKPEFIDSYEAGFKSTLFNRSLLFNATAFYQEYTGFQLNAFNGLVFTVTSVPTVVSKGLDTDFVWFPIKDLSIQGGVTYADTKYPYKDASVLGAPCTSIAYGAAATSALPAGCSLLPGSRLSLAPKVSASLAVTYERTIVDGLLLRGNVSAKSTSDYNTGSDLNPVKVQKGFTVVNARLGLSNPASNWSLEIWAQNLFAKDYYQVAFDATAQSRTYNAFLGAPRTFGATWRLKY
jgi:outer membrane receptor protein involved in Fe transport